MPKRQNPRVWLAAAVALVVAGCVLLVLGAHDRRATGDYLRAPSCGAGEAPGCVRDAGAVVVAKRRTYGRTPERVLRLRADAPVEPGLRRVPVRRGAAYDAIEPPAAVRVRLRDGAVMRVDVPGAGSVETLASPVVTSVRKAVWGLALLTWGLGLVGYARDLSRGIDRTNPRQPRVPVPWPRAVLGLVWFASMVTVIAMEWWQAYSAPAVAQVFLVAFAAFVVGAVLLRRLGRA